MTDVFIARRSISKVKLQTSTHCPRRCVLNGNFFALFRDLINAVRYVCNIELQRQSARLHVPEIESRRQVGREVLWQPVSSLDDRSAAVAHRSSSPKAAPAIAVENLRCTGMRLVESRNDFFSWLERFVTGKPTGDRSVEPSPLKRVLKAPTYA